MRHDVLRSCGRDISFSPFIKSLCLHLKVLIEDGAVVDKLANDDMTPLHVAAENGHVKVAKVKSQCDIGQLLKRLFADSSES